MRRNKKIKKNSVITSGTWWIASLVVSVLIVAMCYYVLDSQCNQIARDISKAENRIKDLNAECEREAARWEEMRIREHLEDRLVRFGLEMRYARHDQIVHMDADGRPLKRANATIAKARARMKAADVALNETIPTTRSRNAMRPTLKRVSSVPGAKQVVRR